MSNNFSVSDVYQVLTYAFQEILPPSGSMHALHVMQFDRQEMQLTVNMFRVETSLLAGVSHLLLINTTFTDFMRSEFPLYICIPSINKSAFITSKATHIPCLC